MKTGLRWSSWKARTACLLVLLPLLPHLTGCVKDRHFVEKNLLAQPPAQGNDEVAQHYRVGCPDVLEVEVASRPELNGRYVVGPDGRIDLIDYARPRVEGRTLAQVAELIAVDVGVNPADVSMRVREYRGQYLLLFGEVIGHQRSVSYQGPETVLDLLRRVGGITAGAEPTDVYVVRPHLGESQRPEVIHVDLNAIVVKNDPRTNVRLLPFDQIFVGATRRAQIERAIPPVFLGVYHTFAGVKASQTNDKLSQP